MLLATCDLDTAGTAPVFTTEYFLFCVLYITWAETSSIHFREKLAENVEQLMTGRFWVIFLFMFGYVNKHVYTAIRYMRIGYRSHYMIVVHAQQSVTWCYYTIVGGTIHCAHYETHRTSVTSLCFAAHIQSYYHRLFTHPYYKGTALQNCNWAVNSEDGFHRVLWSRENPRRNSGWYR